MLSPAERRRTPACSSILAVAIREDRLHGRRERSVQLQIHLLLDDPWARQSIKRALRAGRLLQVESPESWSEVLAGRGWSIFVVDPAMAHADSGRWRVMGRLLEQWGPESVVLQTAPAHLRSAGVLPFREAGVRLDLDPRTDESSMLRTLAVAAVGSLMRKVTRELASQRGDRAAAVVQAMLTRQYRAWTVAEAATPLHVTSRSLRRECRGLGLPTPERLLEWGRLFRALTLYRLGMSSRFALARSIGYGDPGSLYRLGRRQLEHPLSDILCEQGDALLLGLFQDAIAG